MSYFEIDIKPRPVHKVKALSPDEYYHYQSVLGEIFRQHKIKKNWDIYDPKKRNWFYSPEPSLCGHNSYYSIRVKYNLI